MTPRLVTDTCLLNNERGVTLLEVLVTALVIAMLVITIYIGVVYAEKQSIQNYRNRAATLLVSGELERQYFINRYNVDQTNAVFRPFTGREVAIDVIKKDQPLIAKQHLSVQRASEFNGAQQYGYYYLISKVEWTDPSSGKQHNVLMREEYYDMVGE